MSLNAEPVHGSRAATSAVAATAANASATPTTSSTGHSCRPNQRRRDGASAQAVCAVRVSSPRPDQRHAAEQPGGRMAATAIIASTLPPDSLA